MLWPAGLMAIEAVPRGAFCAILADGVHGGRRWSR
jgi:hypothetical protein